MMAGYSSRTMHSLVAALGSLLLVAVAPAAAEGSPAGDDFAAAVELTGLSGTWTGTTEGATAEPGEPAHAGLGAGASVWLLWVAPADGTATFRVDGSGGLVATAAYTGKTVDALEPIAGTVQSAEGGPPLRYPVVAGTAYHIAVDAVAGPDPLTGPVSVAFALFSPPNDDFADTSLLTGRSTTVSTTTFAADREPGEPVHSAGAPTGGSVWFRWVAPAAGTVVVQARDTRGQPQAVGVYTGARLAELVSVRRRACGLERCFIAEPGVPYRLAVAPSTLDGRGAPVESDAVLGLRLVTPANDALSTATVLSGVSGRTALSVRGTAEPGEPAHTGAPAAASRWYRWRPTVDGVGHIVLRGDARVAAYEPLDGDPAVDDLRPLDSAVTPAAGDQARLRFAVAAGAPVLLAVDRSTGTNVLSQGPVTLHYAVRRPTNDRPAAAASMQVPGTATGTTLGATAIGEPAVPGADGHSVWYRVDPERTGPLVAQTAGSAFDTVLGVYAVASAGSRLVVADDDSGPGRTSLATFRARAGRSYLVAVDGAHGRRGDVVLSVAPPTVPVVTVADVSVAEGGTARFEVEASPRPRAPLRLSVATRDGRGATAAADYDAVAGELTLTAQTPRATVAVYTADDPRDEAHETVRLVVSGGSRRVLARPRAEAVIDDDDAAPRLVVDPAEADESADSARFVVRLSAPSERPVTARLATVADGTVLPASPATPGLDYGDRSARLVLAPGEVAAPLDVRIDDDNVDEPDETLLLAIAEGVNMMLTASSARGLIVDDEPTRALDVSDLRVVEGASGSVRLLSIPVTLDGRTDKAVSFTYTTVNATAVGPFDFRRAGGVLHVAPGESGTVVNVLLRPDNLDEGDEYFYIDISDPSGAVIGDERGRVLIVDDDSAAR